MAALGVVKAALAPAETSEEDRARWKAAAAEAHAGLSAAAEALPAPAALDQVTAIFGLSDFERDILTLCAGVELDSAVGPLCATLSGDPRATYPTFSLALAVLPGAHWSALSPTAPLRRWRLIEVTPGDSLTASPLRIDERILHYLAGTPHMDERLAGFVTPVRPPDSLPDSHRALADRVAAVWAGATSSSALPAIQLAGAETAAKRPVAAAACTRLGLGLSEMSSHALPQAPADLESLVRLWEREAALSSSALLLDCDDIEMADAARVGTATRLIERLNTPLLLASRERLTVPGRLLATFTVERPTLDEQRVIWRQALGPLAAQLNGHVVALTAQFNLSAPAIEAACLEAGAAKSDAEGDGQPNDASAEVARVLWDACRSQARPRLDDLAQRIEPAATWDDLVLPEAQRLILREIAAHVRQREQVYGTWGFAAKSSRGLGISALFAGASGTGKTTAAEVLADELRLDLYRIDLSQVVSKYIGETEKNLRRVFDAAEAGGAILLFDEADALFGKRSEVKDSHDRYANIEVSYLLQRMESYRGLAILTTNMKNALDPAFLRRIRFIVHFPFPDAAQRAEIWRRIFPAATPTEGLDVAQLAQLNVPGGNIRNIALLAAFLAADDGEPVRMTHLLRAAQSEYTKLEKALTDAEVRGWA